MIAALCFALISFAAGAHGVVPWRLRRAAPEERRPWALSAALLFSLATLAFLTLLSRFEDAVLASHLAPFSASRSILALGITAAALCLADLFLLLAWRRLEDRGWPLLALFGGAWTIAQSVVLAALAGGDQKAASLALFLRAAVLVALAVAAAEAVVQAKARPGPGDRLGGFAGLALLVWAFALPQAVREPFTEAGGLALLGLAAALLFATRFVPRPNLRRALALAALLLTGWAWTKSVEIAGALAGQLPAVEAPE